MPFIVLLACVLCLATPARAADSAPVTIADAHNSGAVLAIADRPRQIASGGTEGRIRVSRLSDGHALADWFAHDGDVTGLHYDARRSQWLSGGRDGALALWDGDGRELRRHQTGSPVTDLAVDEDRERIATAHDDGTIGLWTLAGLEPLARHHRHRGKVRAVAIDRRSGRIASAGSDGRVLVAGIGDAEPLVLTPPPSDAHDLAFSPDGGWLMGAGWFRLFRWPLARPDDISVLSTPHHGLIRSIQFNRDGRQLATISRHTDSAVLLLDAASGALMQRFPSHDLCGRAVALSRDGRYLVSSGDEASVRIHALPAESGPAP
jgi:WD40 repeat protein